MLHSESVANAPLTFDQTVTGNGKTDSLFVFDQLPGARFARQQYHSPQTVVPEPTSMLLIGGGLIVLALLRRRKPGRV